MNTQQKKPFFNFITQHLPAVPLPAFLLKEIPLPSFLTKPINLPSLGSSRGNIKRSYSKKSSKSANASSAKPKIGQFFLEGILQHGNRTRFAIGNRDFEIEPNTWIIGNVEFGSTARVKGSIQGEQNIATQVVILRGPE